MEVEEGISAKVTVKEDEARESCKTAPKSENPGEVNGPVKADMAVVTVAESSIEGAKKRGRGRPRKYGQDMNVLVALSPMPISASIPLTREFSGPKQGRGRSSDSFKKQPKFEFSSSGEGLAFAFGANFTPHIITVNAGEDVSMKIMSFSQQGFRSICILSANGMISNVTIRQPNSSGGTLTYEGRFEILSLTGSFTPAENGRSKNGSDGMSVSLGGTNGRVVGGRLAGMLVAAGPVQVVVGSFLQAQQQEQPKKKQKHEQNRSTFISYPNSFVSEEDNNRAYRGIKPIRTPDSLHGSDSSTSFNNISGLRDSSNNKSSSPIVKESNFPIQANCEITC